MELPVRTLSHAVLIGTSTFDHLPDLPAVRNNLHDLRAELTHPRHGILTPENCEVVDSPDTPHAFMSRLRHIAARTDDVLFVYYAGHGVRHETRDRLYLTLRRTEEDALDGTAVPFDWVKDVVGDSPARTRVLVLDCCYSGMALGVMSGTGLSEIEVRGTAVLASSPRNRTSHSPAGDRNTAFTAKMLALLRQGSPIQQEPLTVLVLYKRIYAALARDDLPRPLLKVTDTSGDLLVRRPTPHRQPAGKPKRPKPSTPPPDTSTPLPPAPPPPEPAAHVSPSPEPVLSRPSDPAAPESPSPRSSEPVAPVAPSPEPALSPSPDPAASAPRSPVPPPSPVPLESSSPSPAWSGQPQPRTMARRPRPRMRDSPPPPSPGPGTPVLRARVVALAILAVLFAFFTAVGLSGLLGLLFSPLEEQKDAYTSALLVGLIALGVGPTALLLRAHWRPDRVLHGPPPLAASRLGQVALALVLTGCLSAIPIVVLLNNSSATDLWDTMPNVILLAEAAAGCGYLLSERPRRIWR